MPLNILFVTDGIYPFVVGGMQKHATYIIRQLAGTEHQIDVIITDKGITDAAQAEKVFWQNSVPDNIRFHVVPFPKLFRFPGHYVVASYLYSRRVSKKITQKISTFDIIYGKGFSLWHYLTTRKDTKTPVIVQLHGLEMYQKSYSLKEELHKWLIRIPGKAIIKLADFMFSYGGSVKDILIKLGRNEKTIFEQYGAIDEAWLFPEPPKKENGITRQFLFVARYEFRKGYHILKPALESLIRDNESFVIDIVGNVPPSERIDSNKVTYHGEMGAEQIKTLMEKDEVLLVPSLSEGFPTIIIEAMARGMAVASTGVGAVPRILNNDNGYVFEAGNAAALYETMKKTIRKPSEILLQKQQNARQTVIERFQWKYSAKQLVLHLQEAVNDYRSRINGSKP